MAFADALADATQAAVCGWLQNGGNQGLTQAIVAGALTPGGQVPALGAGLGLLALNAGCSYNPNSTTTNGLWTGSVCNDVGGMTYLGFTGTTPGTPKYNLKVVSISIRTDAPGWPGSPRNVIEYDSTTAAGAAKPRSVESIGPSVKWILTPGSGCVSSGPGGLPTGGNPPYKYTDPVTNCVYNVEHLAWDVGADGAVAPVVKVSQGTPAAMADDPAARATGGVIGGCNFDPVLYYGGPGGGPSFPWTPGPDVDGEPWWVPLVRGAAGGVAGAMTSKLLDAIFGERTQADLYRLVSVCEVDAQGEPVSQAREVNLPAVPILNGIVARLDAMEVLMQGLKDFKQPVCPTVRPKPQGELVSVRFVSLEDSAMGTRPLRKEFRYRDQSYADQCAHANHWEGFEWEAGPVCVISKGLSWGVPQVWAATADEGKRVIRHAAAIAGVDLSLPRHEWVVSTTTAARIGRTGRMVPDRPALNSIWVTKRDGSSGPPVFPVAS
jgi:hypothetical protein